MPLIPSVFLGNLGSLKDTRAILNVFFLMNKKVLLTLDLCLEL